MSPHGQETVEVKLYNKPSWAEAVLSAVRRKERRQAFEKLDPSYQARLKHQRELKARWVRRKRKGK